jgi:hypothetical protein
VAAAPDPAAAQSSPCAGDFPASSVEQKPGPPLRFGITPSGAAGQIGASPSAFFPDDYEQILPRLAELRPPGGPFVTHVYTSWGTDSPAETTRLQDIVDRYSREGYLVELVLRYKPRPEQEGDIAAYAEYIRRMVRAFGPNRRVIAFQVTNEVNLTFSGDSSDGIFRGAQDALVQGILAGDDETKKLGYEQLELGFNWFYRLDDNTERNFWEGLRDRGGPPFVAALDWIGLDAYPGTFFPPETPPGGVPADDRNAIVNALSTLRCFARIPGIPKRVPIHVQENGYPTGPGQRTYERQAETLGRMVDAFHDYRGTYNVTDYRWFNMRDADTSSPNFQQQYGLLRSDYVPKPAFGVYRDRIARLSVRSPAPELTLEVAARGADATGAGDCAAQGVSATVTGPDVPEIRSVAFVLDGQRRGRDATAPFGRAFRPDARATVRVHRVAATVTLLDGRELALGARFTTCARRAPASRPEKPGRPGADRPNRPRSGSCGPAGPGVCARNQRGTGRRSVGKTVGGA